MGGFLWVYGNIYDFWWPYRLKKEYWGQPHTCDCEPVKPIYAKKKYEH